MAKEDLERPLAPWRSRLHEIIFEAETPAGRAFDIALIWAVVISIGAVLLESVKEIRLQHGNVLVGIEWLFTILFTVEYGLRIVAVKKPVKYILSFFGIVDLLAILPTYLSLLFPGTQSLLVIRVFRIVRIFRIFKLGHHLNEAKIIALALRASRPKITVFLTTVLAAVTTVGAVMYLVEGEENGFTSIPRGIYWAIVTMTTVGYGDISPRTAAGQMIASGLMVIGYGIIAVPTGIMTTEIMRATRTDNRACLVCAAEGHDPDAIHCKFCGEKL